MTTKSFEHKLAKLVNSPLVALHYHCEFRKNNTFVLWRNSLDGDFITASVFDHLRGLRGITYYVRLNPVANRVELIVYPL